MKQLLMIFISSAHSTKLLPETLRKTQDLEVDKFVFYDSYIPTADFGSTNHRTFTQIGSDKQEKLMNAFLKAFLKDYKKVVFADPGVLIPEMSILQSAYSSLESHEYVLASNQDDKLYLLGMNNFRPEIFDQDLSIQTMINTIKEIGATYCQLPSINQFLNQ